jgi:hypothetical protein
LSRNIIPIIYFKNFKYFYESCIILGGIVGESNTRILRIQKIVVRPKFGVSSRTSCRQLFKELNIFTLASLYILEMICFITKYRQSVQLNSTVHTYNTRRKMDIHIQTYNMEIYKNVINMGTKVYNKLSGYIKEIDSYKAFKKGLKSFIFLHTFY